MVTTPKVSVIMAVYNNNRYIVESVDSVLAQSFDDFEFIIVDDGSTDGVSETLEKYAAKDNRIILLKNETNIGVAKSPNRALKVAKGEYIARIDSDDVCFVNRFQKQVEYLDKNQDIALVYSNALIIDKDSNEVCCFYKPLSVEKVLCNLEIHNYITNSTVMFRRKIFSTLNGYNESCRVGEDRDLWVRMRDSGYSFGYIDEILLKYRINPDSVRGENRDNYWFKLAKYCQWNKSRLASFRYWKKLTVLQKIEILIRTVIPFSVYVRRLK